jgi:hypothetical protein
MEAELKRRDREKLQRLRLEIRQAKALRALRVGDVRTRCRAARLRFNERAKAARKRLSEMIATTRTKKREACAGEVESARRDTGALVARAVEALGSERRDQRVGRIWTKPDTCPVPSRRNRPGLSAAERRQESDCEVSANIEDDGLRVVWERVKGKIKAGKRRSRTEAFLEWAREHAPEVAAIQHEEEERALAELVRQEHQMRKALAKPNRYRKKSPEELAVILEGVPF